MATAQGAARAFLLALLLLAPVAHAYRAPPLTHAVMDPSGVLNAQEAKLLEYRLDRLRQSTGYAIVVFFVPSLEGETVEDVAYQTFNQWGIGEKDKDNGVLLLLAPNDRKLRIETGKGVGGELTDIQSGRILRQYVTPHMKAGRYLDAATEGSVAIAEALTGQRGALEESRSRAVSSSPSSSSPSPYSSSPQAVPAYPRRATGGARGIFNVCSLLGILFILFMISGSRGRRSRSVWWSSGGGGGGGWGGGGGGGGGGYSGGGGSSGGGGASDSY